MTDITESTSDIDTTEGWLLPSGPSGSAVVTAEVAEQLVADARAEGVDLVGPGGLLGDLTKRVLEAGLEAELDEHLGYTKHDPVGRNGENSRNGTRSKTVITEVGPIEIDVPRDRDGSFEPQLVRKRQQRLSLDASPHRPICPHSRKERTDGSGHPSSWSRRHWAGI